MSTLIVVFCCISILWNISLIVALTVVGSDSGWAKRLLTVLGILTASLVLCFPLGLVLALLGVP